MNLARRFEIEVGNLMYGEKQYCASFERGLGLHQRLGRTLVGEKVLIGDECRSRPSCQMQSIGDRLESSSVEGGTGQPEKCISITHPTVSRSTYAVDYFTLLSWVALGQLRSQTLRIKLLILWKILDVRAREN
jgi:hypothetical protein